MSDTILSACRGIVLDADPFIDYVDGTNEAATDWPDALWIDTTGMQQLSVHIYANQATSFSAGQFYVVGRNIKDATYGNGPIVGVPYALKTGDGTGDGYGVTLPTSGNFNTFVMFKDMPHYVQLRLSLTGASSMVGRLQVSLHSWMV